MHLVHEVLNYINHLPPSTWTSVASYLGGSTLVASVLQVVKHKLNFAAAQNLVLLALGFFSFIAAAADFLIQQSPSLSALPFIGHATAVLAGGAVFVHRFAVSPAYYNLSNKLQRFNVLLKEAEKEQSNVSATVTVSPAPTAAATPITVLPDEAALSQFAV